MKKSKFTEEQIALTIRLVDGRTSVGEVCREIGISKATFYNWKKKYGGLEVRDHPHLLQMEEDDLEANQLADNLSPD